MLFEGFAFNESFYLAGFQKYQVQDIVHISDDDMAKVTHALVSYIDNASGDLHVTVTIDGNEVPYFNAKEQAHLTDIMNLVRHARKLLKQLKTAFFALLVLNIVFLKGMARYRFLPISVAAALLSLLSLGAMYFMDFNWAFIKFHEMLFYNDLWLLDPAKDRLLQMMPLAFFMRFTAFWLTSVAALQLIYLFAYRMLKQIEEAVTRHAIKNSAASKYPKGKDGKKK
jgi:integral membrane protein (TIGR01906 family)